MKCLLDTDHITIVQEGSGLEYSTLARRFAEHADLDVAVSIVSFHEQVLGAHTYINRAVNATSVIHGYDLMEQVAQTFAAFSILPFDVHAAHVFEQLLTQRLRINRMDLRIAAIALSRDLTLLTRNISDFGRVPDLRTEDWT